MADYLDQFSSAELATDLALHDLERYLNTQSSKLADFGLPQPEQQSSLLQLEQASCSRQYTDLTTKYQHDELLLSNEQLDIYYTVLNSFYIPLIDRSQTCYFIEGKAGHEKSYTANVLVNRLRSEGYIVLVVGSITLSVAQYERGQTAPSAFGIPVTEYKVIWWKDNYWTRRLSSSSSSSKEWWTNSISRYFNLIIMALETLSNPSSTPTNFLFPDSKLFKPFEVCQRSFLSPLNIYVDEFNHQMLDKILFVTEHKYFSYDSIKDSDGETRQVEADERFPNPTLRGQISTPEFFHELQEPGVPPHELSLKE
ncbi:hypothetical protein L873DRAFT_1848340 [Choiromyces venosus 120613-1]|uniref:ATP-dependent DNA helicase n=1 Tax=Choiromyces venosus 120613-1 TaxID=1336337 RepID=A0A3N4IZP1_9PEZI|nr:hypothetical protein L873DRAFT_1848340 [Choiromyces venosus 120613-1]